MPKTIRKNNIILEKVEKVEKVKILSNDFQQRPKAFLYLGVKANTKLSFVLAVASDNRKTSRVGGGLAGVQWHDLRN